MKRTKTQARQHSTAAPAPRPRWLLPAVVVSLAAVILAAAVWLIQRGQQTPYTPEVAGAPAARLDQMLIDYGDVRFEQPVETEVKVRNVGDAPLQVLGEPRVELLQGC